MRPRRRGREKPRGPTRPSSRVKRWRWAFAAALLVQFVALYRPNPPTVETGLPLDKLVHVGLFASVGLLGVLAGVPVRWLVLGLALQAVLSEAIQGLVPGRGADLWDVVADISGMVVGVGLGVRMRATRSAGNTPEQES